MKKEWVYKCENFSKGGGRFSGDDVRFGHRVSCLGGDDRRCCDGRRRSFCGGDCCCFHGCHYGGYWCCHCCYCCNDGCGYCDEHCWRHLWMTRKKIHDVGDDHCYYCFGYDLKNDGDRPFLCSWLLQSYHIPQ